MLATMTRAGRWIAATLAEAGRNTGAPGLTERRLDAASGRRGMGTFGPINSEVAASATPLRLRSLHAARNNPLVVNGVTALVTGTVGAGIVPTCQAATQGTREAAQHLWRAWVDVADADSRMSFYGLQALVTRTMLEEGEVFAIMIPERDGLRVRVLGADMLPMEDDRNITGTGNRVISGIELTEDGRRVAYHFLKARPDDPTVTGWETIRVPAENVIHVFEQLSPGQLRGISRLASVLLPLSELDKYNDAELMKQSIASCLVGIIIDPNGNASSFSGNVADGVLTGGIEPGTLKSLPPGYDIKFSTPPPNNSNGPFIKTQLDAIAAGLGVPTYLLSNDVSTANYSSLRAALVEFRARIEQFQYNVLIHQFCRPVWRMWVTTEVLSGRLPGTIEDYLAVEWLPPKMAWVDPEKDARAEILAINAGLKSRRQAVAGLGWDIEQLDQEIAADRVRAKALDLGLGNNDDLPT